MYKFNFNSANIKTDKRKKRMRIAKKSVLIKPELQKTEVYLLNLFWPSYKKFDNKLIQNDWKKFNNLK